MALVAQNGYSAVTIAMIAKRARVSPNTFYDHFADKTECFIDAYQSFSLAVATLITQADGDTIEEVFVSMVGAYFSLLEREPEVARAVMIEMDGAGPLLRERRRAAYDLAATAIEERYQAMRQTDNELPPITKRTFLAALTAVHGLAADAIDTAEPAHLTDLLPEIQQWAMALMVGLGANPRNA